MEGKRFTQCRFSKHLTAADKDAIMTRMGNIKDKQLSDTEIQNF
jgi:hypothetical protein